jgi:Transposase, Mutator family
VLSGNRVATLALRVPQDRAGRFSTSLFERYQRSEKALVGAVFSEFALLFNNFQNLTVQGKQRTQANAEFLLDRIRHVAAIDSDLGRSRLRTGPECGPTHNPDASPKSSSSESWVRIDGRFRGQRISRYGFGSCKNTLGGRASSPFRLRLGRSA